VRIILVDEPFKPPSKKTPAAGLLITAVAVGLAVLFKRRE
jgi:hypothetical protein